MVLRFGAAHAPSPDVRYVDQSAETDRCPLSFAHSMLTALRHPACDDQSAETDRCPSNAGSRGMGSPSRMH